jgi:hypothetical protein
MLEALTSTLGGLFGGSGLTGSGGETDMPVNFTGGTVTSTVGGGSMSLGGSEATWPLVVVVVIVGLVVLRKAV